MLHSRAVADALSTEWTDVDVALVEAKLAEARAAGDEKTAALRERLLRLMVKDVAHRLRRRIWPTITPC